MSTVARASFLSRWRGFSRTFWTINAIELLERGAYYTTSAVLTTFLVRSLGFSPSTTGALVALLFVLLYLLPALTAPISERIGYKSSLGVSFFLLSLGYGSLLLRAWGVEVLPPLESVLFSILLIGVGAGSFKPVAAALVAQTTREEERTFAYVIYYGAINLGAFLGPLSVGLLLLENSEGLALASFLLALALALLSLVLSLGFFTNVRPPQRTSVLEALGRVAVPLRDLRFLLLLLIYSGFWFMYALNLTFLPLYMKDFSRMPDWFNVALLQTINPAIIVLVSPLVEPLVRRFEPLSLMAAGVALYVAGFVVVGFSALPVLFLLGIVIFSVGEVLTQPSFLSYVSKMAPSDRVSLYLGVGFVPIGVGLSVGSSVEGILYEVLVKEWGRPVLFFAVLSSLGLLTIASLLLYPAKTHPPPGRSRARGVVGALLALLFVPALLGAGWAFSPTLSGASSENGPSLGSVGEISPTPWNGNLTSGKSKEMVVDLPQNATGKAVWTLTWKDESDDPGFRNTPDTFQLSVTLPNGTTLSSKEVSNPQGGEGKIEVETPSAPGRYRIVVHLVRTGPREPAVPLPIPVGLPVEEDPGNSWTLSVRYGVKESSGTPTR